MAVAVAGADACLHVAATAVVEATCLHFTATAVVSLAAAVVAAAVVAVADAEAGLHLAAGHTQLTPPTTSTV